MEQERISLSKENENQIKKMKTSINFHETRIAQLLDQIEKLKESFKKEKLGYESDYSKLEKENNELINFKHKVEVEKEELIENSEASIAEYKDHVN